MNTFVHSRQYITEFFLELKNVSEKKLQRKSKHPLDAQHFPENRAIYDIMWKHTVQPERPRVTIRRIASWVTSLQTDSEYLIFTAFPQRLRERASMLRLYVIALLADQKMGSSVSVVTVYIRPKALGFDDTKRQGGGNLASVLIKYGLDDRDWNMI
jgi:hypothetical protein